MSKDKYFKCQKCGAIGNWGNGVICALCQNENVKHNKIQKQKGVDKKHK